MPYRQFMRADLLVHRLDRLYTLDPLRPDVVDDPAGPGLGALADASIAFLNGAVQWIGAAGDAPDAAHIIDGRGLLGLPGLVDCHTHAVWGGSRASEMARRLAGERYSDLLEAGGGILSTVRATRAASEAELTEWCSVRLDDMLRRGVTTVEVKSGYGLSPDDEARLLRAAGAAGTGRVRTVRTFLGAHTVPAELRGRRDAYVRQVIEEQLPLCAPLCEAIDVYCDRGAFDLDEAVAILSAGRALGLKVRAHAEQVSHTGIAAAAARLGATCVDHLERLDEKGVAAMAASGTVATLLPGAQLYLRDSPPPVGLLREAGVPFAVATDLNPGSSPLHDLWAAATLSCILQGLSLAEAVRGITRNAGLALGRSELGWLGAGSAADLALYRPPPGEPAMVDTLVQHLQGHQAVAVVRDGRQVI